jgi:hypothetical protein
MAESRVESAVGNLRDPGSRFSGNWDEHSRINWYFSVTESGRRPAEETVAGEG